MSTIQFRQGELVCWQGRTLRFKEALSLREVVVEDPKTSERLVVPIADLEPGTKPGSETAVDLSEVDEEAMAIASERFKAIEPLVTGRNLPARGAAIYRKIAAKLGKSVSTIYRWRTVYLETGSVSAMCSKKVGAKPGSQRLPIELEELVQEIIRSDYLTTQRLSPTKIHERVRIAVVKHGLKVKAPHLNTIRRRIAKLSEKAKKRAREGAAEAEQEFSENVASLVADFPLHIVQIDHTKLNVIIVSDDHRRLAIGRPWITVVIDIYSRMVLGIYISLDAPSAQSVGLALVRAIVPKERWLKNLDVDFEWPCWGKPSSIHADNGRDFRSETIKKACKEHKVDITWRPVRRPNWGGHIEAFMKTLSRLLKELPGATFDNPEERGKYDSEAKAVMTMRELERFLLLRIIGVYHNESHSALGMTPLEKWKRGLWNPENGPGLGLPERIVGAGERKLRLDFLPLESRTIGPYGVLIDGLHYFGQVLRPFVNARMPGRPRITRKFVFRRDLRTVKFIYFWDPQAKVYHEIPARNLSLPEASMWELRETRRKLRADGKDPNNEAVVVRALIEAQKMVLEAQGKTKAARRAGEKMKGRKFGHDAPAALTKSKDVVPPVKVEEVEPFDDVKTW